MATSNTASKAYSNEVLYQKCVGEFLNKTSNVSFVFDDGDDTVKLPAHKEILAASSSVFKRMFNGYLKRKDEVKIIDASSSAFKEFLQFFYASQVNLTMESIGEVLKLIKKYDVADCYPICIDFLKDSLSIDGILWAFNLSLTYKLAALEEFCTKMIQKNLQIVLNMFEKDGNGKVKLTLNPSDRFLSEKDVERISPYICRMSKDIVHKLSTQNEIVFPFFFEKQKHQMEKITEHEILSFKVNGSMLLTDIFCSKVYREYVDGKFMVANRMFDIWIENQREEVLFSSQIELTNGENHIKLKQPIHIKVLHSYDIILRSSIFWEAHYTHKTNVPTEATLLSPNIQIQFPEPAAVNFSTKYTRTLISQLNFKEIKID